MKCLIIHLAYNCGSTGLSALGCRLHAAALVKVLYGGARFLLSYSALKFESHFMVKDIQAARD